MVTFDYADINPAEPFGKFNKPLKEMNIKSMTLKNWFTVKRDSRSDLDCMGFDRELDYSNEVMPAQTKIRFANLDNLPDIKGKDNDRTAIKNQ